MLKRDLIVRQLEEFGKVMALILSWKKQKDWEPFSKELNAAATRFTAFELKQVENMSTVEFTKEVLEREGIESAQIKMLADLLFEKMNYYAAMHNEESFNNLKEKCLMLYSMYNSGLTENEFNLEAHFRIDYLKKLS